MTIIQKKRMMKITEYTCDNKWLLFSGELMFEVLRRLPLKSMCICKSVCKSWRSIISDTAFLNLYGHRWKRSSTLLLSIRDRESSSAQLRYWLATLNNKATLDFEEWLSLPNQYANNRVKLTQVINGLVCFYHSFRVWLFNLSTGDTMLLPFSQYNTRTNGYDFRFFFGFEPISRTYKLLKVVGRACEILTLEENMVELESWKTVADYAPFEINTPEEAVCVDGTLYWLQEDVITFDLNTHKFNTIEVPGLNSSYFCCSALQFKGCLAFAYKSDNQFNLVSLNRNSGWTRQTFELPTELIKQWNNLTPFGSLPTGEIMLADPIDWFTPIYSYDLESQKFERFLVGKFPPLKYRCYSSCFSCFEANFNPLSLILKHRILLTRECELSSLTTNGKDTEEQSDASLGLFKAAYCLVSQMIDPNELVNLINILNPNTKP